MSTFGGGVTFFTGGTVGLTLIGGGGVTLIGGNGFTGGGSGSFGAPAVPGSTQTPAGFRTSLGGHGGRGRPGSLPGMVTTGGRQAPFAARTRLPGHGRIGGGWVVALSQAPVRGLYFVPNGHPRGGQKPFARRGRPSGQTRTGGMPGTFTQRPDGKRISPGRQGTVTTGGLQAPLIQRVLPGQQPPSGRRFQGSGQP
jgi:hypothetical protein